MLSHRSLSDSKSPQVSWTLLSILAGLNKAVVWIVSTCFLISKFSSPRPKPLVTVQRVRITIGITITFMFHGFFRSLARSRYLFFFSLLFDFTQWSARTAKFFWLTLTRSDHLAEIRLSVSQNLRRVCSSHSLGWILVSAYTIWSNFNFLRNSQWITFSTQSCQVLYSFGANVLHSPIIWVIILSLSTRIIKFTINHLYAHR